MSNSDENSKILSLLSTFEYCYEENFEFLVNVFGNVIRALFLSLLSDFWMSWKCKTVRWRRCSAFSASSHNFQFLSNSSSSLLRDFDCHQHHINKQNIWAFRDELSDFTLFRSLKKKLKILLEKFPLLFSLVRSFILLCYFYVSRWNDSNKRDTFLCVLLASCKWKLFFAAFRSVIVVVEDVGELIWDAGRKVSIFVIFFDSSCHRFVVCVNLPWSVTQSCIESEFHILFFRGLLRRRQKRFLEEGREWKMFHVCKSHTDTFGYSFSHASSHILIQHLLHYIMTMDHSMETSSSNVSLFHIVRC